MTEEKCPRCSGNLRFMPSDRLPAIFSWIGGELAGWVVFGSTVGALGCVMTDNYLFAALLGTIAAVGVVAKLEHRRGEPADVPGLFHCPKCQYYFKPERFQGGAGAI